MSGQAHPVLILAGGTGGHIMPGLAVAAALARRDVPVRWLGARGGLEERLVPAAGLALDTIAISALRGRGLAGWLLAPLRLLRAVAAAVAILRRERPRAVLSFGGFAAGPGGLAAWLLRRPLLVHEQNRIPGMTNRALARLARRILAGFPDSFGGRGEWVGNPVRADIAALPEPARRFDGRSGRPRLLVLGGSQGAAALNRALPAALAAAGLDAEVRHQCGARHLEAARQAWRAAGLAVEPEAFIEDMASAYAWADLVLCRAGALTLAELCAAGCASLLVPYPHAVDDHQTRNAMFVVEHGAAELLPEGPDLDARLAGRLPVLLGDRARLAAMAGAARSLAHPDAADRVAAAVLEEARA